MGQTGFPSGNLLYIQMNIIKTIVGLWRAHAKTTDAILINFGIGIIDLGRKIK